MPTIEKRLDELEQRLDEVAARDAIRELTAEYCRNVVRGDGERMVGLFTDDALLVTHFPDGSGQDDVVYRGSADLREAYRDLGAMSLKPFVHNHIIEVEGDRARGTCTLELRGVADGTSQIGAGHYEDEFQRLNGAWKFSHRNLILYHMVPLSQGWA